MKKPAILGILLIVGTTVSSFMWLPKVAYAARDWGNQPLLDALKSNYSLTSDAKLYDMRTDEIAKDVSDRESDIKAMEKELADHPEMPEQYRNILKNRIKSDKKKLYHKGRMLDQATEYDQQILAELKARSV